MPKDDWAKAKRRDQSRRGIPLDAEDSCAADRWLARKGGPGRDPAYRIPAGAACAVRKQGEKRWRPHVLKAGCEFRSFLWRNEGWYGFGRDGWELKVASSLVEGE